MPDLHYSVQLRLFMPRGRLPWISLDIPPPYAPKNWLLGFSYHVGIPSAYESCKVGLKFLLSLFGVPLAGGA